MLYSCLWRIVTIYLLLEKAVKSPVTSTPPSRNLAPVTPSFKPAAPPPPLKVLENNMPWGA